MQMKLKYAACNKLHRLVFSIAWCLEAYILKSDFECPDYISVPAQSQTNYLTSLCFNFSSRKSDTNCIEKSIWIKTGKTLRKITCICYELNKC